MRNNELIKLADLLVKRLKAEGFYVLRYDAHGTNSIYLKLDYGMCNSIRISDHIGYQHLHYRYNIGPYISQYHTVTEQFLMEFYPVTEINALLTSVMKNRAVKIEQYGQKAYKFYTKKKRFFHEKDQTGFWAVAEEV